MKEDKNRVESERKTLSFSIDSLVDEVDETKIEKNKLSKEDETLKMELHHHMAPPGGIIDDLD